MFGKLIRIGLLGWLASVAYKHNIKPPPVGVSPLKVAKHMEVIGSDGLHVGIVDHLAIQLTKSDPAAGGRHHVIPMESVATILNGKLMLDITAAEASQRQRAVADGAGAAVSYGLATVGPG